MPLPWNEIRSRALAFAKEWAEESSEDAEAKSFWDAFFQVFASEAERVAFLFERYQALASLLPKAQARIKGRRVTI